MTHWAMVIDLNKCIGCQTCIKVCTGGNAIPHGANWRQVVVHPLLTESGESEFFFTFGCMHCENPACMKVCPTSATYRRPDGIVDIHYELCVGCGACIAACPYDARRIAAIDKIAFSETDMVDGSVNPGDRIGTCTKCNFCSSRIDAGIRDGASPGVDEAATPLCVRYCLGEALHFGDLEDPDSNVSKLLKGHRNFRLREDLKTGPSVYYLY
jgi:phenylacetyl-CoA:acceptor oxidoreductase subunit 1